MEPHTKNKKQTSHCHGEKKKGIDWVFISSIIISLSSYFIYIFFHDQIKYSRLNSFLSSNYSLNNRLLIGVTVGLISVYALNFLPKAFYMRLFGPNQGIKGLFKAALVGVFFDVCSHGILMIANKLYKQGVKLPIIITFLCASPWNSLSLTIIMISLIGLKLTVLFILLSIVISVMSGIIFQWLIKMNWIKDNPKSIMDNIDIDGEDQSAQLSFKNKITSKKFLVKSLKSTLIESKMVIKWLLVGVVIASLLGAVLSEELFTKFLGPTLLGLLISFVLATIIEVCSQGTVPIASEIINKAEAVGNGFVFLMSGIPTNYSQIVILKEMTGSWKTPLYLAIISIPQILILGFALNHI